MHQAGPEVAADEPRLPDHVDEHLADTRRQVVPTGLRLALEQEPNEEGHPPREEHERNHDHGGEDEPAGNEPVPMVRRQHSANPPFRATIGADTACGPDACQGHTCLL
jgi:hypothetical protein